jgi:phosphatidylserine/phosphatidylglycerophosphate/cardiolipin synthase-like enzyme
MKLTDYAIKELVPFIIGNRKGTELVTLFNKFGARDLYDEFGLPDINKRNGHRPSKKEYVFARACQISGKHELRELLNLVINEIEQREEQVDRFNEILNLENYHVVNQNGQLIIEGGVIDRRKPVVNEAHFLDIQSRIMYVLENARVSIRVVMAWFTNDLLFQKLLEKHNQGIDVKIAIYDDGVNRKHGVDVSQVPNNMIRRGKGGGLMHDKFCVVDNQIVITGSYNWTNNAEFRNDENITIENDPAQATRYSEEFRRLTT